MPRRADEPSQLPRARFAVSADEVTPSTSGTARPAATPDDGGKQPRRKVLQAVRKTGSRQAPANMKKMPPALRVTKENANARMTGANATPQGYYKPSEKQKKFKWRPGTRALREIRFYQKSTALLLRRIPFFTSYQGSGTRFQDGPEIYS